MRIAICDDDERELAHLLGLIKEYRLSRRKDIDCRSFQNSTDFLCGLKGGEYDLILLGAPMSGAGGVQAARELRELDRNVEIIFVSSSPEFAVESYSVGAYYYLLKPVDADSLCPLLDNMESRLSLRIRRLRNTIITLNNRTSKRPHHSNCQKKRIGSNRLENEGRPGYRQSF